MARDPVLTFTDKGIHCPAGDFFIDPWRPVPRAVVTHGHSDHARPGMGGYLTTDRAAPVIRHRLGDIRIETEAYGAVRRIGNAAVSFHPAGHVPGSAQVRVEVAGEIWVVSGNYKVEPDGVSEPWEPVRCHAFVSECTFGLPVFRWRAQGEVIAEVNRWWRANREAGRVSLIGAYALGKAQRVLANVDTAIGPVLTHGAVEEVNAILRAQGYVLPETVRVVGDMGAKSHPGALVIAPPGAGATPWARRFGDFAEATASGWMQLRGIRRRRGAETGFVLSDHADWPGLNAAIRATGAERVFATHGYTASFRRWLEEQGYQAGTVETAYEGEGLEEVAVAGGSEAVE
ncbi:MAG: ligase-associated DNA damage response exonuclease [Pseudomonadota bacterium]